MQAPNRTWMRILIVGYGRMGKLAGYFDGDNYIQHNPQIADKLSGLGAALQAMAKAGSVTTPKRV